MSQSYILIEGVNIYANLFDTNQLSIIRGSSFLLKEAIDHIASQCENNKPLKDRLTPISTGASTGLFHVNDPAEQEKLKEEIVNLLNKHEHYRLFTLIVESCEAKNLLQAKRKLQTQLRISQMQSLTFVPDVKNTGEDNIPDKLEGRRISVQNLSRKVQSRDGSDRQLSNSVCKRLDYGRKLKHDFYFKDENIKNSLSGYHFSNHFEDLANHPQYRKLNGKIAVVYMDGNSFRKKQQSLLETAYKQGECLIQAQQNFDQYIQKKRSTFLHQLLEEMIKSDSESRFTHATTANESGQDVIRIETLLWGGDEMLFVLPAWLGFEFIQYFFEQTQDWKIGEEELTHAAGMVFCSAKTPIKNIRDLAQSIAESVKDSDGGRDQNGWNYMVLESIDYPTDNDISAFNKKYYGESLTPIKPNFLPASANWQFTTRDTVQKLLNNRILPRRQLYRIVQIITTTDKKYSTLSWEKLKYAKNDPEKQTPINNQEIRLLQVSDDKDYLMQKLPQIAQQLFNLDIEQPDERIWLWIYLYELWSYICPEMSEEGAHS